MAQTTFTCDARMYLSQSPNTSTDTTLYDINTFSNPLQFPPIAQGSHTYNATAYNPIDNYLYAISYNPAASRALIRISADGSTVSLGVVSNLPAASYNSGDFSNTGVYYVMPAGGGATNDLYAINVTTRVATLINLTASFQPSDLAWVGGLLYTVDTNGQLRSINLGTGAVTNIGAPSGAITFGAMFGAPNGLFGSSNAGGFYKIDLATGARTLISDSPGSFVNDGAHCPTAEITFPADLAITKTDGATTYAPGTNRIYTIVARNNGPFGAQNARVQDVLPSGVTVASWTCAAANGAVCRTASGSGGIDARVDLPFNTSGAGATASFTLTMAVPAGFTGPLTNTATVAVDVGNTDPVPANNTATDTDQMDARVTLSKVSLGGVGSFGFTGSNGVAPQTLTTTVAGTAVSGTPQVLTTSATSTTLTEGAPPAGYVLSAINCTGLGSGGTATPDLATRTVTLDAAATALNANINCTFTNSRIPLLRLQKALPNGRALAADQFTLNMTGMAGLTTTGTGTTAVGVLTHSGITIGSTYTLSETGAGATDLTYYNSSYACTNALTGGQTPSGSGTSFTVTPVAGDDLTCTLSNAALPADLQIVKTASPPGAVTVGQVVTYTIVATNNGPSAADGARLNDRPTGLDCQTPATTASCTATGGASCPAATVPVALLTGSGGVVLPLFPSGGSVSISLQCTVLP